MPCRCLKPAIIARGAAEPPTSIPFMRDRSYLLGIRVEHREDAEPDRRHSGRPRHPLLDEVLEQALRVEVRPRVDELRADHRRRGTDSPTRSRGTSARPAGSRPAPRYRVPSGCRRRRRACAGSSSGASRGRPSASRSCRSCNTSQPPRSRRARGRRHASGSDARDELLVRVLDHEHVLDLRLVEELLEQRHQAAVDDHRLVARRGSRCTRGRSGAGAGSACAARSRRTGCRGRPRDAGSGSSRASRRGRRAAGPRFFSADRERAGAAGRLARRCSGGSSCRAGA